ncbi:MAG: hypothetical protein B6244_12325 [Candidatus Cloacimonetes bacterium 4572_55]|nr:MAG: hypothetical protein B6244_12325 [Candidatus Cloacimonetes bacterium 4572_55]
MKKTIYLLFILICSCQGTDQLTAQNTMLWNGETDDIESCDFSYGQANNTQAYQGDWCFEGVPDPWHEPRIHLACQDNFRINMANYDIVTFYAKSDTEGRTFDFTVKGWPHTSAAVNIDPYIEGGQLDTTYRLVSIPIDSLKTDAYRLESVETLSFGKAQPEDGHHIFIDEVWAIDFTPNRVDSIGILSNRTIKLYVAERYDTLAVKNLENYQLSGLDGSNFSPPRHPIDVGLHYFTDHFSEEGPIPIVNFELFLIFDQDMTNDQEYHLEIAHLVDEADNDLPEPELYSFTFDDASYINGSVKVNQVGYLPNSSKFGYIGNYLGSAEMMDISPTSFEIRDASEHYSVLTGTPTFRGDDLRLSGEKVYECDFSDPIANGTYYLYVPGVGRSYDFEISPDVYVETYQTCSQALYFQRCGVSLPNGYAYPWTHAACHLEDGIIHESHEDSPLYNGEPINGRIDATGGWHDAGDYGKYIPTAATTLFYLLTSFELYPDAYLDGDLDIPESSNSVPDILDEIKRETDWMLKMQADDGGVYFKVTTKSWASDMPELDEDPRYISEKTTHTTALFAASISAAYRSFFVYFPSYADSCLDAAQAAWQFLEAHPDVSPPDGFDNPDGIGGGEYSDPEGDRDDRAWAAAELYKSTGDSMYHEAFRLYWPEHTPTWGWNRFQHHQLKASWAYATTSYPIDDESVADYLQDLQRKMDTLVSRTDSNIYRNAYRSDVLAWIGYGSFSHSTYYAWRLLTAALLLNRADYLNYAKINLDPQLGANPQSKSYITGVGSDSPKRPAHKPSTADGIAEPVPGLPVFGPHSHMSLSNRYHAEIQDPENLYPRGLHDDDPYPTLRRYFDIEKAIPMSEFTIVQIALASSCFAYFRYSDQVAVYPWKDDLSDDGQKGSVYLYQNFPNPFNPKTTIQYELRKNSGVRLSVYDAAGRLARILVDSAGSGATGQKAGIHQAVWDGRNDQGDRVASGLYHYRLETDHAVQTKQMLMLK